MAKRIRSGLAEVSTEPRRELDFIAELTGERERPEKAEMVSPSIRLTVNELKLLRHVAMLRAGTGKVSISRVIQSLIQDAMPALIAEIKGHDASNA